MLSAQGPVKPVGPVNQPSIGKTPQSVRQRLTTVTSVQQSAEKSRGESNVALDEEKFVEVSPHLKEEN